MAPGPFSGLLAPFLGSRKSKKYEKLQTEDPEKKKQEATQEEINRLRNKIEKLISTMSREDLDLATSAEEACVICCQARAVMQVAPCGHQALCRLCFVHNIQEAVAARDLPLKCLLCGSKIIRVKNNTKAGQGTDHPVHVGIGSTRVKKIPKSVSGYSLCATSDLEAAEAAGKNNGRQPSLAQSQSSYSMSSALSSMSSESGRSVTSASSKVSQRSNSSWFSIGSLSNFQASKIIDAKTINRPPRAHSLSSRGKNRPRGSSASSSSSTLTASASDMSLKNNNFNSINNNHQQYDSVSEVAFNTTASGGLYREPRLNKSDSASLSQHHHQSFLRCQGNNIVPLSPNSIDNRLRAIQISISQEHLSNKSNNGDLLATSNSYYEGHQASAGHLAPIMPTVQQPLPRRGRESFRTGHQSHPIRMTPINPAPQNLNIDNCFVLKSQLRRLSGGGSGKDGGQFGGRARYTKSPELIETTFSMSTIEEEQEITLSLKNIDSLSSS